MTNTAHNIQPQTPNYDVIKTKQQIAWGSGDYSRVGVTLQISGEQLCEAMDLHAGQSVLDVAGGNGNASLAAARRFCKVISTDYVPTLLAHSQRRAEADGLAIEYQQADAEALPFSDNSFDNVISTFGVMFTPNQSQAASELIRVCKPGGKIGMANWTPGGFIGELFKIIGQYISPPSGVNSPSTWGTTTFLENNFGPHTAQIKSESRHFTFRYQSPQHWLDLFATYYGPLLKTFESLDESTGAKLSTDVLNLIQRFNKADDGTMVVPSEYLEIVAVK
ncbi:class I SAM-dependent methyltransferase [Sedimenticola selenatireducens]|uniref:Methyltransferase domain-containing protein n=1 Tax=Sedimenticola selenatireducens TaxID=191960 RepID=A0A557SKD4_9GAMM|nr:class I SAM-dependent methyltransferase [Sedimenticola selenatireducens]TVO77879.1 methyltransferase domain-containing protein [Sedimenticola selenatireducens]TVT65184.1 MAG: methyltransferase domain-containing protein [Sedimenticola selenatireducens]